MSRYLTICAIWLGVFFGTSMAGDWYDSAFHLYQCSASLLILYFVLPFRKEEAWASWLCCFCVLQVFFHAGDYLLDYEPAHYSNMLDVLNTCEAVILFGFGGITKAYRWIIHGRRSSGDHGSFSARITAQQSAKISRGTNGV